MLQIDNRTPFAVERGIMLDSNGEEFWVVVVKGTFEIQKGKAIVAEEQVPVTLGDEYFGEPGYSSLRYESEILVQKDAVDVVINGHAHAPGGKPIRRVDVSLHLGPIRKDITVYGDRVWKRRLTGLMPSKPRPFVKIPLVYERAYGGADSKGRKQRYEPRNPIGVGFAVSKSDLAGTPVANLEDPNHPIGSRKQLPIGFGIIGKSWEPRRSWAGTYDKKWQDERMPLWPIDFDTRFFQCAPPDQMIPRPFQGGQQVVLQNMTPNSILAFTLPRENIGFQTLLGDELVPHRAVMDTILIEPDFPRVLIIWSTKLSCHRRKFDIQWTRVYLKKCFILTD